MVFEHSGVDEVSSVVRRGTKGENAEVIPGIFLFEANDTGALREVRAQHDR